MNTLAQLHLCIWPEKVVHQFDGVHVTQQFAKIRAGFTLIELLVVIAIIAILAGMLLPALAKAKGRGQQIACMSNARQWGLSFAMYLDDSRQMFPDAKIPSGTPDSPADYDEDHPHWSDLAAFAAAGQGQSVWYNVLPPYVSSRPLYQYATNPAVFVNSRTVFTCPTSAAQPAELKPLEQVVFNYGMNHKGPTGLAAGTVLTANSVVNPSAFVFLSDVRTHTADRPFYGPDPTKELGCSHCGPGQLSARHDSGPNQAFLDGHAAYHKYTYLCYQEGTKVGDAGRADIQWTYNGVPLP